MEYWSNGVVECWVRYPLLQYSITPAAISFGRIYEVAVETLSPATGYFSDSFPPDLGRRGAARRSQSTACSRAGFSSSDNGRVDRRRSFALGDRRQSPSGAPGIHLWLASWDQLRAFGRLVPRL